MPPDGLNCRILRSLIAIALCSLTAHASWAAPKRGEVIQTNSVGMSMVSRDFTTHTTKTVADVTSLSEFVGLHYYFVDRWRFGMNVQLTEQLRPALPFPESRIRAFALLPQLGCNFYDPFYAALIYKVAPRTNGEWKLDMAIQALVGVGFALSRRVRLTFAAEAPFAFYIHKTLGLTLLTGISIRL